RNRWLARLTARPYPKWSRKCSHRRHLPPPIRHPVIRTFLYCDKSFPLPTGIRLLISLYVLLLAGSLPAQQGYQAPTVPAKAQKEYEAALLLAAEGRIQEGRTRLEALIDKHP